MYSKLLYDARGVFMKWMHWRMYTHSFSYYITVIKTWVQYHTVVFASSYNSTYTCLDLYWRPVFFIYQLPNLQIQFQFPVVKIPSLARTLYMRLGCLSSL